MNLASGFLISIIIVFVFKCFIWFFLDPVHLLLFFFLIVADYTQHKIYHLSIGPVCCSVSVKCIHAVVRPVSRILPILKTGTAWSFLIVTCCLPILGILSSASLIFHMQLLYSLCLALETSQVHGNWNLLFVISSASPHGIAWFPRKSWLPARIWSILIYRERALGPEACFLGECWPLLLHGCCCPESVSPVPGAPVEPSCFPLTLLPTTCLTPPMSHLESSPSSWDPSLLCAHCLGFLVCLFLPLCPRAIVLAFSERSETLVMFVFFFFRTWLFYW